MKSLQNKFKEIQEKYQIQIKSLNEELKNGYFHTLLNLRQVYSKYLHELDNLFEENEYIVDYDMYNEFYKVSVHKYNLFFKYADYVKGCGNLPGAFLGQAFSDFTLMSMDTLLLLEKNNDYLNVDTNYQLLSLQAYDAILETQKQYKDIMGYGYDEIEISKNYEFAAKKVLLFLGNSVADKAYEYYKAAITVLKESSASGVHNSHVYYTYYITLYTLLNSYKNDIEEYGLKCDFDIDQEIYECMYNNYRLAQICSRDKMFLQVENLIRLKSYTDAKQVAKELIDICEERDINVQEKGVKLSLKNAYELFLNIPELTIDEQNTITEKLNNLVAQMTREDFYCKDGEREYPINPF